jgi:nucleotide-binding universal stress UspA family protein
VAAEAVGDGRHRIVVGVDGSDSSKAALAWAMQQARLTGASLEAVIAWHYPTTYGYPLAVAPISSAAEVAQRVLNTALDEVRQQHPGGPVAITPKVIEGIAARVLLDESDGADLLVVGSRGYGGFAEALLGSVGQHCVHHATCPVVVVRSPLPAAG